MAIIRYQNRPLSLLNELQQEMSNMFASRFPGDDFDLSKSITNEWNPAVDIRENDKQFILTADVPGVDPNAIEVHMEDGVLTIRGEKKSEHTEEDKGFKRIERSYGSFCRQFRLPDVVDSEGITAKTKQGVLEITIPKVAKAHPKKIEITHHD